MHYDMAELMEQANEIQETMGRSYAVPDEIDEADLEAGMQNVYRRYHFLTDIVELAALSGSQEGEDELGSYLTDVTSNPIPDFIDEPPVEVFIQRCVSVLVLTYGYFSRHPRRM